MVTKWRTACIVLLSRRALQLARLWPGEAYARVQRFHDNGEEDDDGEYFGPSDEDLQDLFEMLIGGMLSGQLGGGRASMFGPGGRAGVLP